MVKKEFEVIRVRTKSVLLQKLLGQFDPVWQPSVNATIHSANLFNL